jgi:hypothetical protein
VAEKRKWVVTGYFPSLTAHQAEPTVKVTAGNWKAAVREAVRQFSALPVLKGRKIKTLKLVVTVADGE